MQQQKQKEHRPSISQVLIDNAIAEEKQQQRQEEHQSDLSSPIKQYSQSENREPSILQHKLNKLLNESVERERTYIDLIKQQKEQMFNITGKYGEVIEKYRKELTQFIKNTQEQSKLKHYENLTKLEKKNPPNKYNKEEYTIFKESLELACTIKFLYLTPILDDCVAESYPKNMAIKFMQYYPSAQQFDIPFTVDPRLNEEEYCQCIKNGYPIEIYTKELMSPEYQFVLTHAHEKVHGAKIMNYYKNMQIQAFMVDSDSILEFAAAKIDLEQFLYYSPGSSESWMEKIPLFSLDNSTQIKGFLHLEMSNKAVERTHSHKHHHKTSEPMSIGTPSHLLTKNDKQSRILNRINTYKTAHSNLLLRPQSKDDRLSEQDKNLLLHQKRKELERIEQYKQSTKPEYMSKLFEQAIQLYHTEYCEVGECKYVAFHYCNQSGMHQRVELKSYCKLQESTGTIVNIEMVESEVVNHLLEIGVITLPHNMEHNSTLDFSVENGYVLVVNGETLVVFYKIIIHPESCSQVMDKYQIKFEVKSEYGERVYEDSLYLKTMALVPTHTFILRTYHNETSEIKIEIPNYLGEENLGKSKIAHILPESKDHSESFVIENYWSEDFSIIELKIKCHYVNTAHAHVLKKIYIIIYDINYTTALAVYELKISVYPLLKVSNAQDPAQNNLFLNIGVSTGFKFNYRLPENTSGDGKKLVKFASSDLTLKKCKLMTPNESPQILAQANTEYPIHLSYLTFEQNPASEKVILHCIDSIGQKIISSWLLKVNKFPSIYKHIYKLLCPRRKPYTYNNFEVFNPSSQQLNYRVKSSNYSLLKVADGTGNYLLFSGQSARVGLEISYWSCKEEVEDEMRQVAVSVDDGSSVLLYLFELTPADS